MRMILASALVLASVLRSSRHRTPASAGSHMTGRMLWQC